MSERYSQTGLLGNTQTRVGAPFSSRGAGEAHPGGRFDVTRKPAGNGSVQLGSELAARLAACKSVEDAVNIGVLRPVAEEHFAMSNPSHIAQPRAKVGEAVNIALQSLLNK